MFDINLFANKFVNDKLNEVEDNSISDDEIHQIINKIKDIKKINNDEIIKQLTLKTSECLPKISMSIMFYYFHDQEILYQSLKNIYKNYIHNKYNNNLYFFSFFYRISNVTCYIFDNFYDLNGNQIYRQIDYENKYKYEQEKKWWLDIYKKYWVNNFNFCIFSFSIRRWNKIFLYLSKLLVKLNYEEYKYFLYIEILTMIYKRFIQNNFSHISQKRIINLLAKNIIYIMNNQYFYVNDEKKMRINNYIYIFDTIISQWDLLYPRYKLIFKRNIKQWINKLIDEGFWLQNEKLLLKIISKLKVD